MEAKGNDVEELTLVPSSGGRFEVSVDGNLIWSKLKEKAFPEPSYILKSI